MGQDKFVEWIDHMLGEKISPRLAKKGIGLHRQKEFLSKRGIR